MHEPFSAGRVLATAVRVWARNLAPFLLIAAIAFLPSVLLALLYPDAMRAKYGPLVVSFDQLAALLASSALTFGVVKELQGARATVGACVATGLVRAIPTLAVNLAFLLLLEVGLIALIAPGLYVATRWFVVTQVAVLERRGFRGTFRRAGELTAGRRGPLLGLFLLEIAVTLGASFLARLAISGRFELHARTPSHELAKIAISIVIGSLGSVVTAVAYYYLRQEKEGTTAAELAKVFE